MENSLYKAVLFPGESPSFVGKMEKEGSSLVVTRLTAGIPTSLAKVPLQERKKRKGIRDFAVLMTFLDGKRNLYCALKQTAFDQHTQLYTDAEFRTLMEYFSYLEKYGYIKIEKTSK